MLKPTQYMARLLLGLCLSTLLVGCHSLRISLLPAPELVVQQASTYRGEVSCPSCSERWQTLTLFPDKTYRLADRFSQPNNEVFYESGSWQLKRKRLRLHSGRERSRQFAIVDTDRLQLLNDKGRVIRSIRKYELVKQKKTDELNGPMRVSGLYRMTADGARLHECLTAKDFSVSKEGFGEELARQYAVQKRALNLAPATPILVTVAAEFSPNKSDVMNVLLLDRFWPSRSCPSMPMNPSQPLLLTRWVLTELDGKTLDPKRLDKPAHLRLMGQGHVQAHTGCNTVQARYVQTGENLRFSQFVTTRMACHGRAAAHEQALLKVLSQSAQFEMRGNQLWLLKGDQTLARFLADDMY
jgi:heat shock protein HslJ